MAQLVWPRPSVRWTEHLPPLSDLDRALIDEVADFGATRILPVLGGSTGVYWHSVRELPRWSEVLRWPADLRRLAALGLHKDATGSIGTHWNQPIRGLDTDDVPWAGTDLHWCLDRLARGVAALGTGDHLELPAAIAARLPPQELADLVPALTALLAELHFETRLPSEVVRRVGELIARGVDVATGRRLPSSVLHDGDPFGPWARHELAGVLEAPGVPVLLLHCAALDKPKPTGKWLRRLDELLAVPDARTAVHRILGLFAEYVDPAHDDTDRLMRGVVWALSRENDDAATVLLARVAEAAATAPREAAGYPHAQRTAVATVALLAGRAGAVPVRTLAGLSRTVRNRSVRARVEAALADLGASRGWSVSEVMELAVDDHGLGPDGTLTERLGEYEATVRLVDEKARLTFTRAGRPLKGTPAAAKEAHPDRLKELAALVKAIGKTLVGERQRVEGLLAEERRWTYADWAARYLDHPVTGVYGRRLLWEASCDGDVWSAGLPRRDPDGWVVVRPDGVPVRGDRVRLWHPLRAPAAEVAAWRTYLVDGGIRQPFKQAFREIYLVTPAEEATRRYSNRFAAHILRYRQASALMRVRGWQAPYLGAWEGGEDSEATRAFDGGRWRASFYHSLVESTEPGAYDVEYCSTYQVRFARSDGRAWLDIPVTEVPALVFSEAMRDIDLFVGVTSIAADTGWVERAETRFLDYWHSAALGALTSSGEVRRDALARILPRLRITDRVHLSERFVHVRGNIRSYRVHLGSGNILMEPNDAYLCIVGGPERGHNVHLPFDDDPMLSLILSKVLLLAADDTITDPSIVRQIGTPVSS